MTDQPPAEQPHYFSPTPGTPARVRSLSVRLAGREVEVRTDAGVFSGHRVDLGTRVLLREAPVPPAAGDLLDLGCGWGPLALSMALLSARARIWAVDVNQRAVDLTEQNAQRLGLRGVRACRPEQVPADLRFAAIWSNPPIRIGKEELHALLKHGIVEVREVEWFGFGRISRAVVADHFRIHDSLGLINSARAASGSCGISLRMRSKKLGDKIIGGKSGSGK